MPCSLSLMEYFDPYFFSLLLLLDVICTKYVYVQIATYNSNKYLINSLYFHITVGGSLFVSFTQFPKDLDENYNFFLSLM